MPSESVNTGVTVPGAPGFVGSGNDTEIARSKADTGIPRRNGHAAIQPLADRPLHFCEPHLQHDLLRAAHPHQVRNPLRRVAFREIKCPVKRGCRRRNARQDDPVIGGAHLDNAPFGRICCSRSLNSATSSVTCTSTLVMSLPSGPKSVSVVQPGAATQHIDAAVRQG